MTQRIHYVQQSPELFERFLAFHAAAKEGSIDRTLRCLVSIRASQLNGCLFCLDMHVKQARLDGERELRLHHIAVWRESPLFVARERAALGWTEALTKLSEQGVPDAIYASTRAHFSEKELSDLSFLVVAINAWNRINVAFRTVAGSSDVAFGLDQAQLA
ncbi:carboxymuconolactone decarboxylase family protein [Variovorax sp. J22P240]|uniref:carboxymuconolactone decarboxylase family protein n=1 Tax=Variovorax sp. J22P240 TaxID=3053514 RepID=UPI002576C180|nr:carboxymuconolactone decarboxylase family protein [Variovorax sp. J22P240]MDM0001052.1 carboxymuconolactone decarboxylase family protein [Variovorax sp. J22P240]